MLESCGECSRAQVVGLVHLSPWLVAFFMSFVQNSSTRHSSYHHFQAVHLCPCAFITHCVAPHYKLLYADLSTMLSTLLQLLHIVLCSLNALERALVLWGDLVTNMGTASQCCVLQVYSNSTTSICCVVCAHRNRACFIAILMYKVFINCYFFL